MILKIKCIFVEKHWPFFKYSYMCLLHAEDDLLKRDEFAFPAKALASAYANRRQSIKQLNRLLFLMFVKYSVELEVLPVL